MSTPLLHPQHPLFDAAIPLHDAAFPDAAQPRRDTPQGTCHAVVGLQWGDEGKGKIVDMLAGQHDAVVRYNGGANAGHSVVVAGTRYSLHLIPSGILYPGKAAVIGNGVVVDPWKLVEEIKGLRERGVDTSGLIVSDRAHVVLPYHKVEDGLREDLLNRGTTSPGTSGTEKIGTTRRGIGPAYADKAHRAGAVRMGDLLRPDILKERLRLSMNVKEPMLQGLGISEDQRKDLVVDAMLSQCSVVAQQLSPMIRDTTQELHALLRQGKSLLFEGANGTLLDVDHGTYPYVTGSSTIASGIGTGTGVPASRLSRVIGVMKAYITRVGGGPMPSELVGNNSGDIAHQIRERGREYGTTTGRPRRVGWLDVVALRYSVMINGATGLALTMLDVLSGFSEVKACVAYELDGKRVEHFVPDATDLARAKPIFQTFPGWSQDISSVRDRKDLPQSARSYVEFIEREAGVPAEFVSVGPGREQTMTR